MKSSMWLLSIATLFGTSLIVEAEQQSPSELTEPKLAESKLAQSEPVQAEPIPWSEPTMIEQIPTRKSTLSYPVKATWFVNWAQYRDPPYDFTPDDLSGIINDVDIIYYGFAYFCPSSSMFQPYWVNITECNHTNGNNGRPFELTYIEPKDPSFYEQITNYKTTNTNLKIILSVGGWNFPSNFFSQMVSQKESRSIFIKSCIEYLEKYNFDGIDIDWEYPASKPRLDWVRISCDPVKFHPVNDSGGSYDNPQQDYDNFVLLMKEMREEFDDKYLITFCGQANLINVERGFNIKELVKYVDIINIMTYDYSVSNTDDPNESGYTAPNEPLYPPKSAINPISQLSVSDTLEGYIKLGAPAKQIVVGIAYYGHTWYVPGLTSESQWGHYGLAVTKSYTCCGPINVTYGVKAGVYTEQCGQLCYNEILNAGFNITFDQETMTNIGYMLLSIGLDGQTAHDTWVNFQSPQSVRAIVDYAQDLSLAGVFTFDITQDTYDNGWTFNLTQLVFRLLENW